MKMLKHKAATLVFSALSFGVMATLRSAAFTETARANTCFITSTNMEGKMSRTALTYQ